MSTRIIIITHLGLYFCHSQTNGAQNTKDKWFYFKIIWRSSKKKKWCRFNVSTHIIELHRVEKGE